MPPGIEDFPWAQLGVAAGAVLICIVLIFAFKDILLALVKGLLEGRNGRRRTPTPDRPARASMPPVRSESLPPGPGVNTMFQMTAAQIKEEAQRANETQDERMDRLEGMIREGLGRLDKRADDFFEVEARHRADDQRDVKEAFSKLEAAIKEVRDDFKAHRSKSDDKNAEQDRKLGGLAESFANLQGMIAARRGGTGTTQLFGPDEKK